MRVVSIVGARPQFIKIAPVSRALAATKAAGGPEIEDIIVHTGQHYDAGLSDIFFDELRIPQPDIHLKIGSGSHGTQTAGMLEGIEQVILERQPDIVVVYGDTNSTLAGALAASKLKVPIAHVEAGLRSFRRDMPEEINRIVADHVSDLLLAPTRLAMENLATENLADRSVRIGDVMLDAMRYNSQIARERSMVLENFGLVDASFAVLTIHRASNTDGAKLRVLLNAVNAVASKHFPVVFPVHPRTKARIATQCPDWRPHTAMNMVEPVGYLDMIRLLEGADVVLTDSGGLQKEAFFAGTPCVTLRDETEWTETVDSGANVLVGSDPKAIAGAVKRIAACVGGREKPFSASPEDYYGAGDAAARIATELVKFTRQ